MSDLFGNHIVGFSHEAAHLFTLIQIIYSADFFSLLIIFTFLILFANEPPTCRISSLYPRIFALELLYSGMQGSFSTPEFCIRTAVFWRAGEL